MDSHTGSLTLNIGEVTGFTPTTYKVSPLGGKEIVFRKKDNRQNERRIYDIITPEDVAYQNKRYKKYKNAERRSEIAWQNKEDFRKTLNNLFPDAANAGVTEAPDYWTRVTNDNDTHYRGMEYSKDTPRHICKCTEYVQRPPSWDDEVEMKLSGLEKMKLGVK
jgi:hypothetical protein